MNKSHKQAYWIKLWADGYKLQVRQMLARNHLFHEWRDVDSVYGGNVIWDESLEFRIKPEPKPDAVMYSRVGLAWVPRLEQVKANYHNVQYTFDGETNALKSIELIG